MAVVLSSRVDLLIYIQAYVPLSEKTRVLMSFSLKNIFYQKIILSNFTARGAPRAAVYHLTSDMDHQPEEKDAPEFGTAEQPSN